MMGDTHKSFLTYLMYLIIGLGLLLVIPEKYRTIAVITLILGGLAGMANDLPNLASILTGNGDIHTPVMETS